MYSPSDAGRSVTSRLRSSPSAPLGSLGGTPPSPATLGTLPQRGAESLVERSRSKCCVGLYERRKFTRVTRWEAKAAERGGEIRSARTTRGVLRAADFSSTTRDAITEFHDDARREAASNTRGGCEKLLIAIYKRTS